MPQIILLFGATGFLGSRFESFFKTHRYRVVSPRVDVRDYTAVKAVFEEFHPDIAFNATGKTGSPNVDWCEDHPGETYEVNVGGSLNIAALAHERGVYAVQLSSGCIYNGDNNGKGFTEEDVPNYFGSVYSRSRICSQMVLRELPVLQLRIRIPILGESHPKNLINKLLTYPRMINRVNSCTVVEDLLPAALTLIEKRLTGIYNMTNLEALDHCRIMDIYKEIVDPHHQYHLMSPEEEIRLCQRRSNCVLNNDKREAVGAFMPNLSDSLRRVLKNLRNSGRSSPLQI